MELKSKYGLDDNAYDVIAKNKENIIAIFTEWITNVYLKNDVFKKDETYSRVEIDRDFADITLSRVSADDALALVKKAGVNIDLLKHQLVEYFDKPMTDPKYSTRPDGTPLQEGDWFISDDSVVYMYHLGSWRENKLTVDLSTTRVNYFTNTPSYVPATDPNGIGSINVELPAFSNIVDKQVSILELNTSKINPTDNSQVYIIYDTNNANSFLRLAFSAGDVASWTEIVDFIKTKNMIVERNGEYLFIRGWTTKPKLVLNYIGIGHKAGKSEQGISTVAIGISAGETSQGAGSIGIGQRAGRTSQGGNSVAVGRYAGETSQASYSVAVGSESGKTSQGEHSVAIGHNAASSSQGINSIAIGHSAGASLQGDYSIAIGTQSGLNNQPQKSIVINGNTVGITPSASNEILLVAGTTKIKIDATGMYFNDKKVVDFASTGSVK